MAGVLWTQTPRQYRATAIHSCRCRCWAQAHSIASSFHYLLSFIQSMRLNNRQPSLPRGALPTVYSTLLLTKAAVSIDSKLTRWDETPNISTPLPCRRAGRGRPRSCPWRAVCRTPGSASGPSLPVGRPSGGCSSWVKHTGKEDGERYWVNG